MLFAASGVLKVTDFGIAKVIGGSDTVMTQVGDVLGTPACIAPEQVLGHDLSPATDVYGLATMLHELIAGVFPFAHEGQAVALLFKHVHESPIPLRDVAPHVPEPVAAVVMRGLEADPARRFQTAESFGAALAEAGTKAWNSGWLGAEQVPILDAKPIMSAAASSCAPYRAVAPPTIAPGSLTASKAREAMSRSAFASGNDAASAGPQTLISAPKKQDPAARRRLVIVAVIVIAILAVILLPKSFKNYGPTTSGSGLWQAPGVVHAARAGTAL